MNEILTWETIGQNILVLFQKTQDPLLSFTYRQIFISVLLEIKALGAAGLHDLRLVWKVQPCKRACLFPCGYRTWILNTDYVRNYVNGFLYVISLNAYNSSMRRILLSPSFIDEEAEVSKVELAWGRMASKWWARPISRPGVSDTAVYALDYGHLRCTGQLKKKKDWIPSGCKALYSVLGLQRWSRRSFSLDSQSRPWSLIFMKEEKIWDLISDPPAKVQGLFH